MQHQSIVEVPEAKAKRPINHRIPEQLWIRDHKAEYSGQWVALEGEELVAAGTSLHDVLAAAKRLGYELPLSVHIPEQPELPFGGW